ncbi:NUDIX domain-containing protein [Roseibium sp.]|uniref:NUDIX domain-containing protein n=1 Tax=Roseibium sp. TaxID=1936156 RepID=UPI003A97EF67
MLKVLSYFPTSLTKRLVHAVVMLRNPYCVGVRVLARDGDGAVLLVRHSYLPGWYLPGGGVDKGEVMATAAVRELREEVGIACLNSPRLLGVYLNREGLGRDHIGLFEVNDWSGTETYLAPNAEIVEARFFPLDTLPKQMSPATRRRLQELRDGTLGEAGDGFW